MTAATLAMSACPACRHANADDARLCEACGSPLVSRCPACGSINARTRVRCHHCAARLSQGELEGPDIDLPPPPQLPTLTETADDLPLSLRELPSWAPAPQEDETAAAAPSDARTASPKGNDAGAARMEQAPASDAARGAARALPALSIDEFDHRAPASKAGPTPSDGSASAPATASPPQRAAGKAASFADRKAEARAAVRRARQRQMARQAGHTAGMPTEVLLHEPDPATRDRLATLLGSFGFDVTAVASLGEADRLVGKHPFIAALVGPGAEPGRAASLCARLRTLPEASGRPLAVLALLDAGRHTDRVRMELAGVDTVLFHPVERGQVARALEDSGVDLPSDPRAKPR